jgi:O-antigen ligase
MNRTSSFDTGKGAGGLLMGALLLVAVFFGFAGGLFGFEMQLLMLIVLVPAALLLLEPRLALALLILMLPYSGSSLEFLPRIAQNAVILGVPTLFALRMLIRAASGHGLGFAIPRPVVFYVAVMIVGAAIGYTHLGEIAPRLMVNLARQDGDYGFKEYVIGFFAKQMMIVAMALMIASTVADARRGEWVLWFGFATGVLFVAAMLALLVASGVSVSALGSSRALFKQLGRHSNTVGSMLVLLLPIALFAREALKSPLQRLLLLGVVGVLLAGILLSASRGAALAAAVVFAIYVLKHRRFRSAMAVFTIAVAAALAAPDAVKDRLFQGVDESVSSGVSMQAGDRLTSGRLDIWLQLAPEVQRQPIIGNGLQSTLWSYFNRYGRAYNVNHPHNMFLETLLDNGIVGLICLVLLFRYAWRLFRRLEREPDLPPLVRGAFAGGPAMIAAFLVYGATNGHFYPSTDHTYFWLVLGLAIGYAHVVDRSAATAKAAAAPERPGSRRAGGLATARRASPVTART